VIEGFERMTRPILDLPSPNCREREAGVTIDTLVLHYTGMQTGQAAIDRLRDPEAAVSSHYVVEEDGRIVRLVPERLRAAHAGISFWRGRSMLNDSSIGIEIVNPGHEWGYRPFPEAQIDAVRDLCLGILSRHPIPQTGIVGHSDIAPDRKQDPGELFPWARLSLDGVGLFPHGVVDRGIADPVDDAAGLAEIRGALRSIGYPIEADDGLETVLTAFQRRWRQERVNGIADAGTRGRLNAVLSLFA
jgi:N-acetylmuramoyl-L-alanine amidase